MVIDLVMCKMKHDEILHFEIYIKYLETYFSRAVKNNYSISVLSKGFETVENVSRTDSLPTWIVRIRQLMWRSWWRSSRPGWSVILWCSTMMIERPGPCGTAPCMMRRATSTGLRRFIARSAWWLHNTIATRPLRRQRGRSWKLWGQERPSQWGSGSELSRIFTPMSRLFCQGRRVISNICVFSVGVEPVCLSSSACLGIAIWISIIIWQSTEQSPCPGMRKCHRPTYGTIHGWWEMEWKRSRSWPLKWSSVVWTWFWKNLIRTWLVAHPWLLHSSQLSTCNTEIFCDNASQMISYTYICIHIYIIYIYT